jgi:hypothetical protein
MSAFETLQKVNMLAYTKSSFKHNCSLARQVAGRLSYHLP